MTLQEAKRIAEAVIGKEVYTTEGLVRNFFNAFCVKTDQGFEIYGEDVLIGKGSSPFDAWRNSLDSVPAEVISNYEVHGVETIYFIRRDNDEKKSYPHNTSGGYAPS